MEVEDKERRLRQKHKGQRGEISQNVSDQWTHAVLPWWLTFACFPPAKKVPFCALQVQHLCLTEDAGKGKGRLREELKSEGKILLIIHFCAWNLKFKVQTSFKGIWLKLGEFPKGLLHTEMDKSASQHLQKDLGRVRA